MEADDRRRRIRSAIKRAYDALMGSHALLREERTPDAISRAYFAAFNAVRAALVAHDLEASDYPTMVSELNRALIKKDHMPAVLNTRLADLYSDRRKADYDLDATFRVDDARKLCDSAGEVFLAAVELLKREGYEDLLDDD